jgi:multicomponent Na+:H+ antiporter subunit D
MLGRRIPLLPDIMGAASTFVTVILSILSVHIVQIHGSVTYHTGGWPPPLGIALVLDGLSAFMLVTVTVVAFFVSLYSIDYMKRFTSKWLFYSLFLLMLAGMNGVVITGDIFNLFVFVEIAAIASYALVAFGTEKQELEAAFKYAVMGELGSLFVLLAIAFLYGSASTLNMADLAQTLHRTDAPDLMALVSVLFVVGFGLKAAAVPFHAWLPDAHPSAPAPISAMLSGVLIKSLGVYALCRIFYNVLGLTPVMSSALLVLGVLSMVIGVFLAVGQWDMKRLLAYHSISQIGYVLLGVGLGTPLGILGGLFHLLNHSMFKSLLFLNSGAVEYAVGTRDLRKMGGLAKHLPVTTSTSLIASMSIAGIPPFNGFWSKLVIIIAAVEAGRYGCAFWAVLASLFTLASFMKVMSYAFYGQARTSTDGVREVPAFMQLAMVGLAIVCVLGGLLLLPLLSQGFLDAAADVLVEGTQYGGILVSEVK